MLSFYKPNQKGSGAACSWSYRPSEGTFFVNMLKQASWNAEKRTGSFAANKNNPNAKISCKFSVHEIGSILTTIERGIDFSTVHTSPQQTLQIRFEKYARKDRDGNDIPGCFSLALTKNVNGEKTSIICGFTSGESRALREYLITALQDHFRRAFMWQPERREESAPVEEPETIENTAHSGNEEYLPIEQEQTAEVENSDLW